MHGLLPLLPFIAGFIILFLIGFLRHRAHELLYSIVIYLVVITAFILLEMSVTANYGMMALIAQYSLLPPFGAPLGYGTYEIVNRIRGGDYQGGTVIIRKLMPIVYMLYLLSTALLVIPALILSISLLLIEWYRFRSDKYGLVLTMMNTLTLVFMPIAIAIPSSIVMAIVLDTELTRRLHNPWPIALTYAFSALLAYPLLGLYRALVILIPIIYVMLIVTVEAIMYLMAHFSIEVKSPLRAVEGKEFTYNMLLRSKPRVNALITVNATDGISLTQPSQYFNGSMMLKARVVFERSGIFNPRVVVSIEDPRGFIKLRREVDHPPIVVIPRSTYILGLYQRMLSGGFVRGLGEVTEVRDYMPGDPIRRIHWPKSAKFDKYVIKVSSKFTNTIAIIPYASNVRSLSRIEEVLMTTVVTLLSQGVIPTFLIIDPINYGVTRIEWSGNYVNTLTNVLRHMKSLDIKYLSRGLGSEVFQGVRIIHRESIVKALSKIAIEKPLILIGEERLSIDVLNALQELVGRENVKYILI